MTMIDDMRRANGTGTTYLRPNGMWQARLTLGSSDGRQVRRSFYGRTRAEAEAKMEAARRDLDVGLILPGPRLTVARYLRDWLVVSETRVRPSTWTRYRQLVENNIIPAIGHVPLSKLTPEAVERMLRDAIGGKGGRARTDSGREAAHGVQRDTRPERDTGIRRGKGSLADLGSSSPTMDAEHADVRVSRDPRSAGREARRTAGVDGWRRVGVSRRTAHHMRAVLRTALRRAEKHGLVRSNAAELAEAPSVPKAERPILDPSQVRELLVAVKGDRLEALYWLAVATGLREGELLGLRWRDVDLDGPTLRVAGQLQRVHGTLTWLDYAKTERSIRHIGIPAAVLPVLRRHMASQSMERRVAMDAWADWGLVFTRPTGEPLYGTLVHREWVKWRRELSVPQVRFHDLRGSAASLMLSLGVDLKTIQTILGHANIRTTADVYLHTLAEDKMDAAQRVSEALAL